MAGRETGRYIVLSLLVAAIGGGVTFIFRDYPIGISIGTGLVAGGVALLILSFYEIDKNAVAAEQRLLLEEQRETLNRQKQQLAEQAEQLTSQGQILQLRAPVDLIRHDPVDLYCKARKVVTDTSSGQIYVTDFRYIQRNEEDNEHLKKYLEGIRKYYQDNPEAPQFCRVLAAGPDHWEPLRTNLKLLQPLWEGADPKVRTRAYIHNPVQIDLLIGEHAVLMGFSDHTVAPRTGLLIESDRVARALGEWFRNTVWDPDPPAERPTVIATLEDFDKHMDAVGQGKS